MSTSLLKTLKRERRHRRIRAKVFGTEDMPRLSVYRSNKFVYAQIINDEKGITLASASTKDMKGKGMLEKAKLAGAEVAKRAQEKKIKKVVFDRGGFIYTGRVKALAEGAREGGLKF
jgi:large subunit ribosomal protein L18